MRHQYGREAVRLCRPGCRTPCGRRPRRLLFLSPGHAGAAQHRAVSQARARSAETTRCHGRCFQCGCPEAAARSHPRTWESARENPRMKSTGKACRFHFSFLISFHCESGGLNSASCPQVAGRPRPGRYTRCMRAPAARRSHSGPSRSRNAVRNTVICARVQTCAPTSSGFRMRVSRRNHRMYLAGPHLPRPKHSLSHRQLHTRASLHIIDTYRAGP